MANDLFIWYGLGDGTKTNVQDGRNWVNAAGTPYGEARYPGSDAGKYDEMLFSGALGSGASSPTTGLDLSAKEELASLLVEQSYDGDVGTTANPLIVKVQHDTSPGYQDSKVVIDGMSIGNNSDATGIVHLKGATGATYGLRRVSVVNAAKAGLSLDGKIDVCHILRGLVVLKANINVLTELFVGYVSAQPTDVKLTIPDDGTVSLPSEIVCAGGQVTNGQAFTTVEFYGGTWTHEKGGVGTALIRGGSWIWEEGDIDYIYVHSGLLDGSGSSDGGRQFKELHVYPSGRADLRNDLHNNAVAEGGFIQNWGGKIDFSVGQKLMPLPSP